MLNRMLLILLVSSSLSFLFSQSNINHLRQKVFYINESGITDQSEDIRAEIGDSSASNLAYGGMKKIVQHDGTFYHIFYQGNENGDSDVYLRTSRDGITWSEKVTVNDDDSLGVNQIAPLLAIYGTGAEQRMVAIWSDYRTTNPQIRAAVSTDRGQTWGSSVAISSHDNSSSIYGSVAVDSVGTFYVAWMRSRGSGGWGEVFFSRSEDGGLNWSAPIVADPGGYYSLYPQIVARKDGEVFLVLDDDQYYKRNIVLTYSGDRGKTWQVRTQPTQYPTNDKTYVPSFTMWNDNIYILFKTYVQSATPQSQISFVKSEDSGQSWTPVDQVNDSVLIEDPNVPAYSRFYPCITAAHDGQRLYSVWADGRENPKKLEFNVFFSYSLDGGQSWSTDVMVNEDTSGTSQMYPSVAVKEGPEMDTVLVVWQDDRPLTTTGWAESAVLPEKLNLSQNYPNPFNPSTRIRFSLSQTEYVSLKIYDVLGRQIRSLLNRSLTAGAHTVTWNGKDDAGRSVSAGVYFYQMEAGTQTMRRKMVLLK